MRSEVRLAVTGDLPPDVRRALRAFLDRAYEGDFYDDDWEHASGGCHAWCVDARGLVAHGSVVPRTLSCAGRILETGHVEAVAVRTDARRRGLGTAVMGALQGVVRERFEIGALSSNEDAFYAHLGWERWRGPTWVAGPGGLEARDGWIRTKEEDGGIFVLCTPRTPALDVDGPIVCEWRSGDVW